MDTKIPKFRRCVIQNFPFIEQDFDALTDYGLVSKIVEYLNNVITQTNTTTENMQALQTAFNTLKDYVDHYFDTLDVQDEVNNKLEVMATDGTLENIINQEIFGEINNKIDLINSEKTVFVGDSYALGVNPDSDTLTPWCNTMAGLMGLSSSDYTVVAEAGCGFNREGTGGHTFLTKLQSVISTITNKNMVKNVIVCGGYNDNTYTVTNIKNEISSFVTYCKQQFPNATIYIGCIGYRREISDSAATTRSNIAGAVYPAYANNVSGAYSTSDYVYLNGVENILKSNPTSYMYADNAHPNQVGQNMLARGIYQAWKTGFVKSYSSNTMTLTNSNATEVTSTINVKHADNQTQITITSLDIKFATGTLSLTAQGGMQTIAQYAVNNFIGGTQKEYTATPCIAVIQDYTLGRHTIPAELIFDVDGNLKLQCWNTSSGSSQSFTDVKEIYILRCKCVVPELFS